MMCKLLYVKNVFGKHPNINDYEMLFQVMLMQYNLKSSNTTFPCSSGPLFIERNKDVKIIQKSGIISHNSTLIQ